MNANTFMAEVNVLPKPFFFQREIASIKADLVLGSPKSGCSGVGICHISASGDRLQISCPAYSTRLYRSSKGGLAVVFGEDQLPEKILLEHFGNGVFKITDRFILPKSVANTLGISKRIIYPGQYKVVRILSCLIVEFD